MKMWVPKNLHMQKKSCLEYFYRGVILAKVFWGEPRVGTGTQSRISTRGRGSGPVQYGLSKLTVNYPPLKGWACPSISPLLDLRSGVQ